MNSFRSKYIATIFSFMTGVLFLNLCFFLAEVSLLEIRDHSIIENIAKLISNGGLEEEQDSETSQKDSSSREVDLLVNLIALHQQSQFLIIEKANRTLDDFYPHANYSQTFSPPPDYFHFL